MCSVPFSFRMPRVSLWGVAFVALMFAGQAWGQMSTMLIRNPFVLMPDSSSLVPIDSSQIYLEENFTLTGGGQASFNDGSSLDSNGDGLIDPSYHDLDGGGPGKLGIVDWVIVELRFVNKGEDVPTNRPGFAGERMERRSASKTGLLLSDGSIVDSNDLESGGLLTFEDVEFDPDTEDMYLVVDHRAHLGIMSADPMTANGQGILEYDFTDAQSKAFGGDTAARNVRVGGGTVVRYVAINGDINSDGFIDNDDVGEFFAQSALGGRGYRTADVNFDTIVDSNDFVAIIDVVGTAAQFAR